MSSKCEPAVWSGDTGQQIPCFDMCQLTITLMFHFKNECECFIRVSKHEKIDESTRPQAKCFYCFRVLKFIPVFHRGFKPHACDEIGVFWLDDHLMSN